MNVRRETYDPLGERRFADEIKFTEVTALDGDAEDYIPLSALDRFIDWRKQQQEKKPATTPRKKANAPARTGLRCIGWAVPPCRNVSFPFD